MQDRLITPVYEQFKYQTSDDKTKQKIIVFYTAEYKFHKY